MNIIIFQYLYSFAHQSSGGDKVIVFFAHIFPYIVILLAVIFLLFHHDVLTTTSPLKSLTRKWKEILLVFFSGIFAWCLTFLLKVVIAENRPFLIIKKIQPLLTEIDFSFPSGHATFFMALAFAIFFAQKKLGYLFMFFALIIGVARIMAGVHFPIDILAGFIFGALIALVVDKFIVKGITPIKAIR